MAHELTVRDDGRVEGLFVNFLPWHNLGKIIEGDITSAEAIELAGLDWGIVQKPLGYKVDTPEGDVYHELSNFYANLRSDNGYFLGAVSNSYKVVENKDGFSFLDQLIEDHEMFYESCFSLRGGKQVVLLARLPKIDFVVEDDPLLRYVLLSLDHTGKSSIMFGPTSVRVCCANTYRMALSQSNGKIKELSISHKGNIEDKLTKARQILSLANEQFEVFTGIAKELASKKITIEEWNRFLNIIIPLPDPADSSVTKRTRNALTKLRIDISDGFLNGECQNLEGIERSGWAAYNAVSEVVDHYKRRGANPRAKFEARFNTVLYGSGYVHKNHALETICNLVGVSA